LQIITITLPSGKPRGIEVSLQELAANGNPLIAAKGRMLLQLVRHLRSSGPNPRALGWCFQDELHVFPNSSANHPSVTISVDWQDYGPKEGELPKMHYRLQISRPGATLSKDVRSKDVEEVERVLYEAFGWRV
jgi:hypothetical protein